MRMARELRLGRWEVYDNSDAHATELNSMLNHLLALVLGRERHAVVTLLLRYIWEFVDDHPGCRCDHVRRYAMFSMRNLGVISTGDEWAEFWHSVAVAEHAEVGEASARTVQHVQAVLREIAEGPATRSELMGLPEPTVLVDPVQTPGLDAVRGCRRAFIGSLGAGGCDEDTIEHWARFTCVNLVSSDASTLREAERLFGLVTPIADPTRVVRMMGAIRDANNRLYHGEQDTYLIEERNILNYILILGYEGAGQDVIKLAILDLAVFAYTHNNVAAMHDRFTLMVANNTGTIDAGWAMLMMFQADPSNSFNFSVNMLDRKREETTGWTLSHRLGFPNPSEDDRAGNVSVSTVEVTLAQVRYTNELFDHVRNDHGPDPDPAPDPAPDPDPDLPDDDDDDDDGGAAGAVQRTPAELERLARCAERDRLHRDGEEPRLARNAERDRLFREGFTIGDLDYVPPGGRDGVGMDEDEDDDAAGCRVGPSAGMQKIRGDLSRIAMDAERNRLYFSGEERRRAQAAEIDQFLHPNGVDPVPPAVAMAEDDEDDEAQQWDAMPVDERAAEFVSLQQRRQTDLQEYVDRVHALRRDEDPFVGTDARLQSIDLYINAIHGVRAEIMSDGGVPDCDNMDLTRAERARLHTILIFGADAMELTEAEQRQLHVYRHESDESDDNVIDSDPDASGYDDESDLFAGRDDEDGATVGQIEDAASLQAVQRSQLEYYIGRVGSLRADDDPARGIEHDLVQLEQIERDLDEIRFLRAAIVRTGGVPDGDDMELTDDERARLHEARDARHRIIDDDPSDEDLVDYDPSDEAEAQQWNATPADTEDDDDDQHPETQTRPPLH
jgi:hypothetical protein